MWSRNAPLSSPLALLSFLVREGFFSRARNTNNNNNRAASFLSLDMYIYIYIEFSNTHKEQARVCETMKSPTNRCILLSNRKKKKKKKKKKKREAL